MMIGKLSVFISVTSAGTMHRSDSKADSQPPSSIGRYGSYAGTTPTMSTVSAAP